MSRLYAALALFLISALVHAQEAAVAPPLPVDADPTGMIVFALLLVGSVAWYIWFIWKKEKQRKQHDAAAK